MLQQERRGGRVPDRRRYARGGRRSSDCPGRHPRILIVDYDQDARRPILRFLEASGFDAREAGSSEAAASQIEAEAPGLVVADFSLPASDVLRRCLDARRDLPLIVTTTGYVLQEPESAAAILMKPFALDRLLHAARRALRQVPSSLES
jgi:DNA-binding response OmpR family regulator